MVVNHMSNYQFHKWNTVQVPGSGAGPVFVRTEIKSVILETTYVLVVSAVWPVPSSSLLSPLHHCR